MIGNQKNIQNFYFNYEHTTRTTIKATKNTATTKIGNRNADNRKVIGIRIVLFRRNYYE